MTAPVIRSVAVIGAGAMGRPMARRLHASGFAVTACDIDPAALSELAGAGLRVTRAVAD